MFPPHTPDPRDQTNPFAYTAVVLHYTHHIKGVKKVRSAIKLCSYYFSHDVSNDINVTGIL